MRRRARSGVTVLAVAGADDRLPGPYRRRARLSDVLYVERVAISWRLSN